MLQLIFVGPKFRLPRVQKKGKKGQKNEKLRFAKNIFLFLRVHELEIVLGVNTGSYGLKKLYGVGVLAKNFL